MGERKHPATAQKIALAKRKGQVWRAPMLAQHAGIVIFIWITIIFKTMVLEALNNLLELGGSPSRSVAESLSICAWVGIGLVLAALSGVAVFSSLVFCAFGGFVVSIKPICPTWSRIDPAAGFLRIGGSVKDGWQIYLRFLITVLTMTGVVFYSFDPGDPTNTVMPILIASISLLVFLGSFDAICRMRKFYFEQRMTDEELRREMRDNDGDPVVRAMQRSMREALSRGEILSRLRQAKVIVVRRAKGKLR